MTLTPFRFMGNRSPRVLALSLVTLMLLSGCFGFGDDSPPDYPDNPIDEDILGCMNETATNYDSNATVNDGSCEFEEETPEPGCPDGFEPYSEDELVIYEGFEDVEDDDPRNTIFKRWEGAPEEGYTIVTEVARSGAKSFRVNITPDDQTQSGSDRPVKNRAEFGINAGHGECIDIWYGWAFMIPEDYIVNPENGTGFNVIAQWHEQTGDPDNPSTSNPPLSIVYGSRDGQTGIGFKYGLNDVNRHFMAEIAIEKGVWYDLVYHIGWSMAEDGYTEVWLNGESITNGTPTTGPNMHNWLPHYWKAGLYRGEVGQDSTLTNNSIFFDEFRIGMTYDAVAPS